MFTNLEDIKRTHTRFQFESEGMIRRALSFYGNTVVDNIRAGKGIRFQRRTGALQEATTYTVGGTMAHSTLRFRNDIKYARPIEFGSVSHPIKATRKPFLVFFSQKAGHWVRKREVTHPGNTAYRFLLDNIQRVRQSFVATLKRDGDALAKRF